MCLNVGREVIKNIRKQTYHASKLPKPLESAMQLCQPEGIVSPENILAHNCV